MNDNQLAGKKSLGQHWLHDEVSLQNIFSSASITDQDTILEIGPGLGSLTAKLVRSAKQVVAVELDQEVIDLLSRTLKADNLTIVHHNILEFDLTTLSPNYKVVANIPYYLTSNLLRVLCESPNSFSQAVLLVQKEVAERVAAAPGKMSLLSVSVQYYCEVKLGSVVAADKFTPPPKVDSQVLILSRRSSPMFPDVDTKKYFRLVKAGFSQRRKTLLNSLSGGLNLERDQVSELIAKTGISAGVRPQTLTLEDWHSLYKVVY